ncbi:hypothetical protein [Streptomyces sp. GESEQ-35]|nr:hypothetical protein [Streptomyces sp. GESEQ-35]
MTALTAPAPSPHLLRRLLRLHRPALNVRAALLVNPQAPARAAETQEIPA